MVSLRPATADEAIAIITHHTIRPAFEYDGADLSLWLPKPYAMTLAVVLGGKVCGLFYGVPRSNTQLFAHVALLPELRNVHGVTAGRMAIDWVWENTEYTRIVGEVPECNRQALAYDRAVGLRRYGLNPKSVRINGIEINGVLVGTSKGE